MGKIEEIPEEIAEDTPAFFKQKGNNFVKEKNWDEAIEAYSSGLELCPLENPQLLAILFTNRAVCFINKNDLESALEDCHAAIEADPAYPKGYWRRSQVYEKQKNPHEALSDLRKAKELDNKLVPNMDISRLEKQSQEQFEREKTEVVDKLKGMGNFLLGKFGMSLDNFKLEQTPEGSYSIKFDQNPQKSEADK